MAKKSLTKAIDKLVSWLGKKPATEPMDRGYVKSRLMEMRTLAKFLEQGEAIGDAEAKVTTLEQQIANLEIQLKKSNAAVESFRGEQKKREEENRDLPDDQFKILEWLPSEHSGEWPDVGLIAAAFNIPIDEAEVRLDALRERGFVYTQRSPRDNAWTWFRSMPGNKHVLARRLASEEERKKTYKYADLPQVQHEILLAILRSPNEDGPYETEISGTINKTLEKTKLELRRLRKAGMATDGDQPQATYGLGQKWWLLEKGNEYLDERGGL